MSEEGRRMMESIRDDAGRIKEQLRAEKAMQDAKDREAEGMFGSATGRRIAKPTAKASRFSDVHMAQFKKMDSIENHPSSFRARQGFARPTAQSLKRTSSKAHLDELERPKTAGKSPSTRITPPIIGRPVSTSPFKSIHAPPVADPNVAAKRLRRDGDEDVSDNKTSTIPRPVSSRLLSPTKASAARAADNATTPVKSSAIPRSNSVKAVRSTSRASVASTASASKRLQVNLEKPLPPIPSTDIASPVKQGRTRSNSIKSLTAAKEASTSKIPALASLKSILRSPRKDASQPEATTPKYTSTIPIPASSHKKVDFTPSVKSRYAVKLAEASPSPAKLDRSRFPDTWKPAIPYDSSAFIVNYDEEIEDDNSSVVYPELPDLSPQHPSKTNVGPVDHTVHNFAQKAKEHGRRESKEFKSIFTTLHPKSDNSSLTSVNTNLNKTNPISNAARVAASPLKSQQNASSIRRIRPSDPVLPFEDRIQTVPHGLPGKKRRMESEVENEKYGNDDDAKENRRVNHGAHIPGAWNESFAEHEEDEGEKRGGKRAKVTKDEVPDKEKALGLSLIKKPSAARELAAKTAKDRKAKASPGGVRAGDRSSRGVLSLSRLNVLARPKSRG